MLKYYGDGSAVPGDIITVNGIIQLPDERRNPGCFDYALYLRSIGIRTVMTAEQLQVYRGNTVQGKLYVFREIGETFSGCRQKPPKAAKNEKISVKTLAKTGKTIYSLTAKVNCLLICAIIIS